MTEASVTVGTDLVQLGVIENANVFLKALRQGGISQAGVPFGDDLERAVSSGAFNRMWTQILDRVGALKDVSPARSVRKGSRWLVTAECRFRLARFDMSMTFDEGGQLCEVRLLATAER